MAKEEFNEIASVIELAIAKVDARSTSSHYQARFDAEDLLKFGKMFYGLDNERKRKLSTGNCVENTLYNFVKQYQYITSAHNLILDLGDNQLTALFGKEEIEDVKELPIEVASFLGLLQGKRSFDDLFDAVDFVITCPKRKPDVYWLNTEKHHMPSEVTGRTIQFITSANKLAKCLTFATAMPAMTLASVK
ncbi:hypothetical protein BD560DRAFT_431241 [Blakeslea trispora]|nr:hypothetical protein BD560DRAFT_431241 [Blakeslea trispora]